jgi:hypothetical protein
MSPFVADIVAKRFLVLERRTVFSHLDRNGNFDSQNRPFGSIVAESPWLGHSSGGLLQQYRPDPEVFEIDADFRLQGYSRKHLLSLSSSLRAE